MRIVTPAYRANTSTAALFPTLAPKPDSKNRKNNEGHDADPRRYGDAPCCHFHSKEDAKELRKGNQPEEDGGHQRRWLVHFQRSYSPHALVA